MLFDNSNVLHKMWKSWQFLMRYQVRKSNLYCSIVHLRGASVTLSILCLKHTYELIFWLDKIYCWTLYAFPKTKHVRKLPVFVSFPINLCNHNPPVFIMPYSSSGRNDIKKSLYCPSLLCISTFCFQTLVDINLTVPY